MIAIQTLHEHSLASGGRWAKLYRAASALEDLKAEIRYFADPQNQVPIAIRQEVDPNENVVRFVLDSVPECPLAWGLAIGEIVHNLRGALDHLVWDLAVLNCGREPTDTKGRPWRTQFPICSYDTDWPAQANSVGPLSDSNRGTIESVQPYRGWQGPRRHPLLLLQDLSNADKHRVLRPALWSLGGSSIKVHRYGRDCEVVGSGTMTVVRSLYPGAELLSLAIVQTGPDPRVHIEPKFSVFPKIEPAGAVDGVLDDILAYASTILVLFESDLATDNALALREVIETSHREDLESGEFGVVWAEGPQVGGPEDESPSA